MLNESLVLIREAIEANIADKNRIQGLQNEITKAEETKRHNYLEVSRLVAEYLYGQGAKTVKEMERTCLYPHRHWLHQAIYQVCQGEGDLEVLMADLEKRKPNIQGVHKRDGSLGADCVELATENCDLPEEMQEKVRGRKAEILSVIENHVRQYNPQEAFEKLAIHFSGHNKDCELFDFNYGEICSTIFLRNGNIIELCKDCEVWDSNGLIASNYQW